MKKWADLVEVNKDDILKTLEKAYIDACGAEGDGFQECVDITKDGEVSSYTIGDNSTSMDVLEGETLEIARVDWFNPWSNEEEKSTRILEGLTPEEAKAFQAFLGEEEACMDALNKWNSEIVDRVRAEYIDDYGATMANDWAVDAFNQCVDMVSNMVDIDEDE